MSVLQQPPQNLLDAVVVAQDAVAALASYDVSALSGSDAVEVVTLVGPMSAQIDAVLVSAGQVVRESGVWGLDGSRSAKAYLERTTGASAGKVASDLKLAERLGTVLPLTADALRTGAISGEHARVMSRAACSSPARIEALADPTKGEGFLLDHAGLPVDQFKTFVAAWGYRVDPDADDAKRREAADSYHFDLAETLEGVHVRGFLTPESGGGLLTALSAVIGIPSTADGRTPGRRRHDALATLCQLGLDGPGLGISGGVRPQVVVHVDLATLIAEAGTKGLDPAVLQESGTPIPRSCSTGLPATARSRGSCSARSRRSSTSDGPSGRSPERAAGHSTPGTVAAEHLGATHHHACARGTTRSRGGSEVAPVRTTGCCSATPITAGFTTETSGSSRPPTGVCDSRASTASGTARRTRGSSPSASDRQ